MSTKKDLCKALRKLATGYDYEEREIIIDKNGKPTGNVKIYRKHVPPSAQAINKIMLMMENEEWEEPHELRTDV